MTITAGRVQNRLLAYCAVALPAPALIARGQRARYIFLTGFHSQIRKGAEYAARITILSGFMTVITTPITNADGFMCLKESPAVKRNST